MCIYKSLHCTEISMGTCRYRRQKHLPHYKYNTVKCSLTIKRSRIKVMWYPLKIVYFSSNCKNTREVRMRNMCSIQSSFNLVISSIHRYDAKKGFYCQILPNGKSKCLGIGKGRQYEAMDDKSEDYLLDYYRQHNIDMESLLARLGQPSPKWLQESLSER